MSQQAKLKDHIKAVHERMRDFECKQCDFKGSHRSRLNGHVRVKHASAVENKHE